MSGRVCPTHGGYIGAACPNCSTALPPSSIEPLPPREGSVPTTTIATVTRFEKVAGRCPMGCGETLFLGTGGHVTCSLVGCPDPCAADDLLDGGGELAKLRHTKRTQHGMLKQQGKEIVRLNRRLKGYEGQARSFERTNGRLAKDLIDAWEFIWRIAGGALVGGNARHAARNHLLKAKTTEADRAPA